VIPTTEDQLRAIADMICVDPTAAVDVAAHVRAYINYSQELLVATAAERDAANERLDLAWGLIANASGGDWSKESPEWQAAAAHWRDGYHTPKMHDAPAAPEVKS
jgi:hypothetical protein